jgi:hypothetical protein
MATTRLRMPTAPTTPLPSTTVADLPPLHVTSDDIPANEHLTVPQSVIEWQNYRRRAPIVIGVVVTLCVLILVALAIGISRMAPASHTRSAPAPTPVTLVSPFTGDALTGVIAF